jgi:Ni,Fe-hydrogenase I small subunit
MAVFLPPRPILDCIGLQFDKKVPGGLLPAEWRSRKGLPVINISGCPAHPNAMTKTLAMLISGLPVELDPLNRPRAFFNTLVHQGCTRVEYHEYDVEDTEFGNKGCSFFNLGCQGPMTMAVCNTELWNGRSSKTRAGVPCFGCTSPDFPVDHGLFRTEKIGEIPVRLPLGVERANYMAYKSLAHEAAPLRVLNKTMDL